MTMLFPPPLDWTNRRRVPSPGLIRVLLDECCFDHYGLLSLHYVVRIIANTGVELPELARLRFRDVDFPMMRIFIAQPNDYGIGRYMPIGQKTAWALFCLRKEPADSECALGSDSLNRLHRIARLLPTVTTLIGLGKITLQDLRRAAFCRFVDSGAPQNPVSHCFGFSGVAGTSKSTINPEEDCEILASHMALHLEEL